MQIIKLREQEEYWKTAAAWFHEKWGVPQEAYEESMLACLENKTAVPQWYLAVYKSEIIGGAGVIENDFHNRKDLSPNLCALFVEEAWRNQGVAGNLLQFICDDMQEQNIPTLYLLTDHTSFYERYHWKWVCMAQSEDGEAMRIYRSPDPQRSDCNG